METIKYELQDWLDELRPDEFVDDAVRKDTIEQVLEMIESEMLCYE